MNSSMPTMRYRLCTLPQFTLSGAMLAILWLSVCFAAWRVETNLGMQGLWAPLLVNAFRYVPIPTAIGALFGHTMRGFFAGVALYAFLMFIALSGIGMFLSGDGP